MLNVSSNELKLIEKGRGIRDYKNISEERLLSSLKESEFVKQNENNFDDARIAFPHRK